MGKGPCWEEGREGEKMEAWEDRKEFLPYYSLKDGARANRGIR